MAAETRLNEELFAMVRFGEFEEKDALSSSQCYAYDLVEATYRGKVVNIRKA